MAKFIYQARNAKGAMVAGQFEADDESDARVNLRAKGLTPLSVTLIGGAKAKTNHSPYGNKKVDSKDLQIFTRQFATLIGAGIPILDALKILSEGKKAPVLKAALLKVRENIESGQSLGDSMAMFPTVFDRLFVNMMRAGEEAGILDNILNRLASYLEKSEKIKKQIKGAMVYPAMIIFVAIVVVIGILVGIIPKFQELYSNSGKELPEITQMVVAMSNFCIEKWYLLVATIVGGPLAFLAWADTAEGKEIVERALIHSPAMGELVLKSSIARMTRTLSTLLTAGVPVINALEIAGKTSGNVVIEEVLLRSRESVIQGKPLAVPLIKSKIIPDMLAQMVAVGEASGTLDVMLAKVADFYEDDVENAVKALTSLIEPILMVVLGGVIAFLVIAMYLPVFDMASIQGG